MQPLWSDLKGLRTNRNRSDKTVKTEKTETVLENVAKRNARNKDTEIISLKSMAAALKNRTKWPNVSGPQMNPILACRPGSKHGKSNSFARTELRPKRRSKWSENADAKRINGVRERKKVEKFPFWQQQRTRTYFPIKKFTVFFLFHVFFSPPPMIHKLLFSSVCDVCLWLFDSNWYADFLTNQAFFAHSSCHFFLWKRMNGFSFNKT